MAKLLFPYLNSSAGRALMSDIQLTLTGNWEAVAVQLTQPPLSLRITAEWIADIKINGGSSAYQQCGKFLKNLAHFGGNITFEEFARACDGAFLGRLAGEVRKASVASSESVSHGMPAPAGVSGSDATKFSSVLGLLTRFGLEHLAANFVAEQIDVDTLTDEQFMYLGVPLGSALKLREAAQQLRQVAPTESVASSSVNIQGGNFQGAALNFNGDGGAHVTNTTVNVTNYFKEQYKTEADAEIAKKLEAYANGGKAMSTALRDALEKISTGKGGKLSVTEQAAIQLSRRPALFIRNGDYEFPATEDKEIQELHWKPKLDERHERLKDHIRCVGRVATSVNAPIHIGTAWILADLKPANAAERVIVTNRHVAADLFNIDKLTMLPGVDPIVDFKQEYDVPNSSLVAKITRALWISTEEAVDIAFLLVNAEGLPSGIPWSKREGRAPAESEVVLIGYPGNDWKCSTVTKEEERARLFKGIYNVKRLQPGVVINSLGNTYRHDASTLGGNSGSVMLDLADECAGALGLHYSTVEDVQVLNLAHVMATVKAAMCNVVLPTPPSAVVTSIALTGPRSRVRVLLQRRDSQTISIGALRDVEYGILLAVVRCDKMVKVENLPKTWRFLDSYGDRIGLADEETLLLKDALRKDKDNQDAVCVLNADET